MQIRKTGADDYSRNIKALIVGDPGAGKTLISSTFPDPFYVSAEGGLMSIADKNVPYAEVTSSDDLVRVKKFLESPSMLEANGLKVKTIVIDTIDEIQRFMMTERMQSQGNESMTQQDWGWLGEQMGAICRGFRNMPYHVVFTCHQSEVTDQETGKSHYRLSMGGAIKDQLPQYVDLALAIRVQKEATIEEGELHSQMVRKLLTFPTPKYPFLKDRSGKLPKEIEVNLEDDFDRIHEYIYGNVSIPESEELDIDDKTLMLGEQPEADTSATVEKVAEAADSPSSKESSDEEDKCAECGEPIGDFDSDLPKLMFREILCRKHFEEKKENKNKQRR